jgi:heme/copper-type cytochrome/quinol oxidase subunit 4
MFTFLALHLINFTLAFLIFLHMSYIRKENKNILHHSSSIFARGKENKNVFIIAS